MPIDNKTNIYIYIYMKNAWNWIEKISSTERVSLISSGCSVHRCISKFRLTNVLKQYINKTSRYYCMCILFSIIMCVCVIRTATKPNNARTYAFINSDRANQWCQTFKKVLERPYTTVPNENFGFLWKKQFLITFNSTNDRLPCTHSEARPRVHKIP